MSDATGNANLARVVSTVQIDDDESPPGELAVSLAALAVDEGDGTVTIEVTRSDGSDGEVSIDYATGGGGYFGSDFTAAYRHPSLASLRMGTKEISVAITDDAIKESDEDFTVTLSNPTGGATLGGGSTTVTITADDSAGGSGDNDSGGGGGGGGCFRRCCSRSSV